MTRKNVSGHRSSAFKLLKVLAWLGLVVSSALATAAVLFVLSPPEEGRRSMVPRQQLAAVQSAVSNFVAAQSMKSSVEEVRKRFESAASSKARLSMVGEFLDEEFFQALVANSDIDRLQCAALKEDSPPKYLVISDWSTGAYPRVEMFEDESPIHSKVGVREVAPEVAAGSLSLFILLLVFLHKAFPPRERGTAVVIFATAGVPLITVTVFLVLGNFSNACQDSWAESTEPAYTGRSAPG